MRIIAVSDIHLDINIKRKNTRFQSALINYLSDKNGDILVLAGDIAGNTKILVDFLQKTRNLDFKYKIYVPGNHDVWVNQNAKGLSWIKYYEILPEIVQQFNWYYLPNNPLVMEYDDKLMAFIGTMGWYDYSSRNKIWDNHLSDQDYENKRPPTGKIELMDRYYVKFDKSDTFMANQFIEDLKNDIDFIQRRYQPEEIDQLVVISHMVPFEEFISYRGILKYDFFTAYFGNLNLGSFLTDLSKSYSIHSIFGQTHIPKTKRLSNTLKGYCVPIGYPREYGTNISLSKLFDQRVVDITI